MHSAPRAPDLLDPVTARPPRLALPPRPSEFLSSWFHLCPPDQLLEVRALRITDKVVHQRFFTMDAIDELVGHAFSLVENHDVYFGACPRVRPQGDKSAVTIAPGFWCDLDFKRFPEGEAEVLRRLAEFPLRPTWIIATGGGYHSYFQLTEPTRADGTFEARLKGLAHALNADPAATDRSRVLRVPGTYNLKRDFHARILSWPSD